MKWRSSRRQILFALGQPRNVHFHHRQPVIEILAKALLANRSTQIVIRGGDDADIHFARRKRSHALHFLILQNAQKLGLRGQRHVADLVQEQSAAVGVLEQARLVRWSPR